MAQTESEKEILKYTLCSTHNLSRRKARKMYGICRVGKRSAKVNNAIKVAKEIRKKNIALAKEEKKILLVSSGLQTDDILSSSSESDDTSSDYSDCTELSGDSGGDDGESASDDTSIMESAQLPTSGRSCGVDHNDFLKETGMEHSCQIQRKLNANNSDFSEIEIIALNQLREVSWNWFAFVKVFEKPFETHGYTLELLDQFLTDFATRLPNLGLNEEEMRLTEQSRLAYLKNLKQKEVDLGRMSDSSTDSSEDERRTTGGIPASERERITNKLHRITEKFRKKAKREIVQERLPQKKVSGRRKLSLKPTQISAK